MKYFACIAVAAILLSGCKKENRPLHSGTITYYHELNGKIVSEVYIPSAFTPGNDGINDIYKPLLRGFENRLSTSCAPTKKAGRRSAVKSIFSFDWFYCRTIEHHQKLQVQHFTVKFFKLLHNLTKGF